MTQMTACNCIGPQNGQPLCPCQMRGIVQQNGRWIRTEQDLGPVSPPVDLTPLKKLFVGCICPVGAEISCQGASCPRKNSDGATS